jgi:hypothetical protein
VLVLQQDVGRALRRMNVRDEEIQALLEEGKERHYYNPF